MKNLYPFFSQNPLDRLDLVRRNNVECENLKRTHDSIFLLFDGAGIIIDTYSKNCFFSSAVLDNFNVNYKEIVLLGRVNNINYFSIDIKEIRPSNLEKISIRDFVMFNYISEEQLGIIAQAAAIINWHNLHQYCAYCGGKSHMMHAGWRRDCQQCGRKHFPRVDPVVIMLVTYGEYCLLGRGVNFNYGRYSCLAGYMESGETVEDAARRELYEEAGVRGAQVSYISSQPWPFPSALMLGVHVEALGMELHIDYHEIADAKWIHKDIVRAVLNGDTSYDFNLPPKIAIGRNLLEYWVRN